MDDDDDEESDSNREQRATLEVGGWILPVWAPELGLRACLEINPLINYFGVCVRLSPRNGKEKLLLFASLLRREY